MAHAFTCSSADYVYRRPHLDDAFVFWLRWFPSPHCELAWVLSNVLRNSQLGRLQGKRHWTEWHAVMKDTKIAHPKITSAAFGSIKGSKQETVLLPFLTHLPNAIVSFRKREINRCFCFTCSTILWEKKTMLVGHALRPELKLAGGVQLAIYNRIVSPRFESQPQRSNLVPKVCRPNR